MRLSSLAEARSRPNGFSMTMRAQAPSLAGLRQAGLLDLGDHFGVNGRRRRQIEQAIALEMALFIQFIQAMRKLLEPARLIVFAGDVGEGLREGAKALFAYSATLAVAAHGFGGGILKGGVAQRAAREADNGKAARQRPAIG